MIQGYRTPRGVFVMADRTVSRGRRVMADVVTPRGTTIVKARDGLRMPITVVAAAPVVVTPPGAGRAGRYTRG